VKRWLATCFLSLVQATVQGRDVPITILHTCDLHGNVLPTGTTKAKPIRWHRALCDGDRQIAHRRKTSCWWTPAHAAGHGLSFSATPGHGDASISCARRVGVGQS